MCHLGCPAAWRRPKPPEAQQSCQNKPRWLGADCPSSQASAPAFLPARTPPAPGFPSPPLPPSGGCASAIVLPIIEGNCSLLGNWEAEKLKLKSPIILQRKLLCLYILCLFSYVFTHLFLIRLDLYCTSVAQYRSYLHLYVWLFTFTF